MNILKCLVLFITLFNIAFALLPTSPGKIEQDQLTLEPSVQYYGYANVIGMAPLSDGCNGPFKQIYPGVYNPIVILNQTAILVYSLDINNQLSFGIVTPEGINLLQVPSQLQTLASSGNIQTTISYDDKLNSYFFLNGKGQMITFNIANNNWVSTSAKELQPFMKTYYDLTSSTYYAAGSYQVNVSSYQGVLVSSNNNAVFYSEQDLRLSVGIDSDIQVSGYQNNIIIFGSNSSTQKSYLHLFDTYSGSSQLITSYDYGATFVTSVNPRYILLVNAQKTSSSLIDLQSLNIIQNYTNICSPNTINSFLSSIITKDIFIN